MKVAFDHAEPQTSNITSFWFKPERPTRFVAGQFTELRLPHPNTDNRGDKRWFTVSSAPTEDMLAITTKFAIENGSSFKETLKNLQPGTELNLAEPMGDFVLPKDPAIPLVFVAGGIGITPFHSIVKWLSDTGERRYIHLIYSVSRVQEIVFKDLFKTYGTKVDWVVKDPPEDWQGLTGQLSGQRILELIGDPSAKLIYTSGPEPMVEAFEKDLKSHGLNRKQLVTDFFPGYTEV